MIFCVVAGAMLPFRIAKRKREELAEKARISAMTPEEQSEEYEKKISRYEVISVTKYLTPRAPKQKDMDVCYSFSYIRGGEVKFKDRHEHLVYSNEKVTLGDKDMYIINHNNDTYTLQLTKETFSKL